MEVILILYPLINLLGLFQLLMIKNSTQPIKEKPNILAYQTQ